MCAARHIRFSNLHEKVLAFLMGCHSRLGEASSVKRLDLQLFDAIVKHIPYLFDHLRDQRHLAIKRADFFEGCLHEGQISRCSVLIREFGPVHFNDTFGGAFGILGPTTTGMATVYGSLAMSAPQRGSSAPFKKLFQSYWACSTWRREHTADFESVKNKQRSRVMY